MGMSSILRSIYSRAHRNCGWNALQNDDAIFWKKESVLEIYGGAFGDLRIIDVAWMVHVLDLKR